MLGTKQSVAMRMGGLPSTGLPTVSSPCFSPNGAHKYLRDNVSDRVLSALPTELHSRIQHLLNTYYVLVML